MREAEVMKHERCAVFGIERFDLSHQLFEGALAVEPRLRGSVRSLDLFEEGDTDLRGVPFGGCVVAVGVDDLARGDSLDPCPERGFAPPLVPVEPGEHTKRRPLREVLGRLPSPKLLSHSGLAAPNRPTDDLPIVAKQALLRGAIASGRRVDQRFDLFGLGRTIRAAHDGAA